MLNRIINYLISRQEAELGTRLDYVREIAGESEAAFFKITLALSLARQRQVLPRTAHHLAGIVATQHENCGECLETAVNAALKDEVPWHYVHAALEDNYHLLPTPLEEVCTFARATALGKDNAAQREDVRARYGTRGLVELGLAIAGAGFFPTVKRALVDTGPVPGATAPNQIPGR